MGRFHFRFDPSDPAPFLYRSCFSLEHGDFKRLAFVREEDMGGMDLHDLHAVDFGPFGGDRAVDHGEAL